MIELKSLDIDKISGDVEVLLEFAELGDTTIDEVGNELEKFINDLKKNFSNMSGDDQKEATHSMKAAKDRISFLEKEYSQIEKKAK